MALVSFQLGADTTGCESQASDTVAQEQVWTGYWAFFDEQSDATDLRASFRFGSETGTPLSLETPAEVTFDAQVLGFDPVWDWHAARRAGEVSSGAFEYRDADGRTFVAELQPYRRAEIPADFPTELDTSRTTTLAWIGPALEPDEIVEVNIASASNRLDFAAFFQRTEGATDIVLDAERLSRVGGPAAVLVIRRSVRTPLTETPGAGGAVTMTFQTEERSIQLN